MARQLSPTTGAKSVLVFGCQWLSFDADDFRRLRATVLDNPEHHWMLDVLSVLPDYFASASKYIPSLNSTPGEQKLRDLGHWFRCDDLSTARFPLAYVQLAPLLMMTHFTQYWQYMYLTHSEFGTNAHPVGDAGPVVEIVGFCIGFLSAAVVSAATSREELQRFEGVAIRLAMLLGALGDLQETAEAYTSLATLWKSPDLGNSLPELLQTHPGSYITVHYDENRVTVMTPRRSMVSLQNTLQSAGFSASHVDFNGRYHWSGHQETLQALFSLCAAHTELQLPRAEDITRALRGNTTGEPVQSGALHEIVLRAILAERCLWLQTFSTVYRTHLSGSEAIIIEFGPERCIPPTLLRQLPQRVVHFADLDLTNTLSRDAELLSRPVADTDIAIVGMACRVAGADDINEFWNLLCKGESQHQEMPRERCANYETPWRPEAQKKPWFGNFVRDIDAFDHKFFKKSPREAMSQDPQQRLMLQVAYQALEQAGYFSRPSPSKNIGCYIASCTVDYEHNVNCHPASAYAATGLLRSFLAGKISHYFGWCGPSLCIDTACSGSTVALHHACRAILNGDCTTALVGGANAITSPLAYDNLAGASFLSPTGACKPFDAKADGYCRGEGFAAIYIKKLSDAVADGDPILATIAGTAVEQNNNCTPIVVPDALSLAGLFKKVTDRARLHPRDITVVEAHGTGTQAGDPAEYRSVKDVLGGPRRVGKLALGSVKGLVGHTEGVSGMIALCKVVLMIDQKQIPPQPGFRVLNPNIKTAPDDHINIATELTPWEAKFRAALINNYGACGSNASMVIAQRPGKESNGTGNVNADGLALPFRLCAAEKSPLQAYAVRLREFIINLESKQGASLADISFNAARQCNPHLDCHGVFRAKSMEELKSVLSGLEHGEEKHLVRVNKPGRPVIMCFGGQVGRRIGLDRGLYGTMPLFRYHLDACDRVLRAAGEASIYPDIFSAESNMDAVQLQAQLFSLQYACARSWIESGLAIAAVVGHSFGELTALCISGVLCLEDALKIILRRAALIRDHWGPDTGAMLAVEGDRKALDQYLTDSSASIACFNGPRSFTVAGPTSAIEILQVKLEGDLSFQAKILDVTNAFHCALVDPLLPELSGITDHIKLKEPTIALERATMAPAQGVPGSTIIADHLRHPVFFANAVERLAARHGPAVWLEAGSSSTIVSMARRALGPKAVAHTFHPVNVTSHSAQKSIVDTTFGLWKDGVQCSFWAHHPRQSEEYTHLFLPPYQFEKSRHWMENKPLPVPNLPVPDTVQVDKDAPLFSFAGYQDPLKKTRKFIIHTNHPRYIEAVSGHVAAKTAPIAPASVILDYAVEILRSLPEGKARIPSVYDVISDTPLCLDLNRELWIELETQTDSICTWRIKVQSQNPQAGSSSPLLHCTGRVTMRDASDRRLQTEFTRYSRLVSHARCVELLSDPNVDDILQGRNVYRAFAEIVDYSERYRGVQKLVGKGSESAGRVVKQYSGQTWADPFLCDSFSQVGGFWVNCMTDRSDGEIYIASGMEQWTRSPRYAEMGTVRPHAWEVWARHQSAEGYYTSDIFVFGSDGELAEVFLGLRYSRVAKSLFVRLLGGTTPKRDDRMEEVKEKRVTSSAGDIVARVKAVVAEFCAVDTSEVLDNSHLADAGVDSLMAMELARELEEVFHCTLAVEELLEADTFRDLVRCVQSALGDMPEDISTCTSDCNVKTASDTSSSPSGEFHSPTESVTSMSDLSDLGFPHRALVEAFLETKALTDQFLAENRCSGRLFEFTPLQINLCLVLTLEAFETLGSDIRSARAGEHLSRVRYDPQHQELIEYLYNRLADARLIELSGTTIIRTAIPGPTESSTALLQQIENEYPEYAGASKLTFYTGSRLASVLCGDQDGLQLIFGTPEGQKLVSWMYGEEPHNVAGYKLMAEFIRRVVDKVTSEAGGSGGPLKILEMGAGTGGGTKWFLPLLATLRVPVEYTFSDISPAFLAQARRKFHDYPFIRYCVHDIEKPPTEELRGTQHIIIASNAVHATSNLRESTRCIRQALRPDGVLLMLEMTKPVFAIDLVFGLFRGWWVFNDGRTHAITNENRWKDDLSAVGYGYVDWTEGESNEVSVQRVILATAGEGCSSGRFVNRNSRWQYVEEYVERSTQGFTAPTTIHQNDTPAKTCVLVTGTTGSLGSHLIAHLASLPTVHAIVCLNRPSRIDAFERQMKALSEKDLSLSTAERAKLIVLESSAMDAQLGLTNEQYKQLQATVTHVVHNAWPMNGVKSLVNFEDQFRVLRSLIDFTHGIAELRTEPVRLQFISSIGTVGAGGAFEEYTRIDKVLANGYNEAKFVCERMVQQTLQRYPEKFQAMIIRPGQIAGSARTGYWNASEHFPAMVKSSRTLGVFPSLQGRMGWTPVDIVAEVLGELLLDEAIPDRVYHIDNPVSQDWDSVVSVLAEELEATKVPFSEWIRRVRESEGSAGGNPGRVMVDWLEENFERMSCRGGLDTSVTRRHSKALREMKEVSEETVRKFVRSWRKREFFT